MRTVHLEKTHTSAAVAQHIRREAVRRPKMRRPKPKPDPSATVTVELTGQLVDIASALATIERARSRRAVVQALVEDGLWTAYAKSEQLRRHVTVRIAGRAESKKTRERVDDLYDPVE